MRIPYFRKALYAALVCGVACFFSPFGWGVYTSPLPIVNMVLSLVFFLMVGSAGLRTLESWWQTPSSFARWPMLLITTSLLVAGIWIGLESLWMQDSSVHNQQFYIQIAVVLELSILAVFVLQEILWKRTQENQPANR